MAHTCGCVCPCVYVSVWCRCVLCMHVWTCTCVHNGVHMQHRYGVCARVWACPCVHNSVCLCMCAVQVCVRGQCLQRLGQRTSASLVLGAEFVALVAQAGVGARQVLAARLPAGICICTFVYVCKKRQRTPAVAQTDGADAASPGLPVVSQKFTAALAGRQRTGT